MRTLAFALSLAALLALPAQAGAPEQPKGVYHVKLACYHDDTLILESAVSVLPGFTAMIDNTRSGLEGQISFSSMIRIHSADPANAVALSKPAELNPPDAILCAAQHYSFAGLRFSVYCPGADRFEAEAYWSKPGPLVPSNIPGTGSVFAVLPESEWTFLGQLSAALDTPDLGVVEAGGFMQPLSTGAAE